jgi:trimeric autotransporter adhesin
MNIPRICLALGLLLFATDVAHAARPAAPQVTVGGDLKLLRFDWAPVAGASFYRLWIKPGGSRYIAVGERIPASITHAEHTISVHLQDWARTRYVVTACNAAGCTHSRALNPRPLMLETIGYMKASNPDSFDHFGRNLRLSADGYTLAVAASREASNASGVNGNQADNSSPNSGAVYVFRRRGNTWQQEAFIKAGVNQSDQFFGTDDHPGFYGFQAHALNADGSMLAVGASRQDVNGKTDAGAVYLYRRIGSTWSLMATLHAPTPTADDRFGHSVDMSRDGRTLKVNSSQLHTGTGNPELDIRTHIFVRPASTWQFSVTLGPVHADEFCRHARMNGDGNTLVLQCRAYENYIDSRIVTMKRVGHAWVHVSDLTLPLFTMLYERIELTPDAHVMAFSGESGPGDPRLVYVYLWNGANWVREVELSADSLANSSGSSAWGRSLALDDDGRLLAIGDSQARDRVMGVSSTVIPVMAGLFPRGALYLYQRDASAVWALCAVVTAPTLGLHDGFASSIALSATGRTLAVGAIGEDGGSTGIDGDRNDESTEAAGAVFLY